MTSVKRIVVTNLVFFLERIFFDFDLKNSFSVKISSEFM